MAPKDCKEGAWQYCNYGYDKTKYSSFNDCMKGELKKCDKPIDVKWILTEDYTAGIFQMKDEAVISIAREFKKGQVIDGTPKTNAAGKTFIVLDDNFAVPIEKTREYVGESPSKQDGFSISPNALRNIVVVLVVVALLAIIFKN